MRKYHIKIDKREFGRQKNRKIKEKNVAPQKVYGNEPCRISLNYINKKEKRKSIVYSYSYSYSYSLVIHDKS